MTKPTIHKDHPIGFHISILGIPYISTENSYISFLPPRLMVIDKQEMSYLVKIQQYGTLIIVTDRSTFENRWQCLQISHITWFQDPPKMTIKITSDSHCIEIISFRVNDRLFFDTDRKITKHLMVILCLRRQFAVISCTPYNLFAIVTLLQLFPLTLEHPLGYPRRDTLLQISFGKELHFAVLATTQHIIQLPLIGHAHFL